MKLSTNNSNPCARARYINNEKSMVGRKVTVIIDRPMGSAHPNHPDLIYQVNYGYIPNLIAGDGEEQDAYVLGVDCPVESFEGMIVAIIERKDDVENKFVVAPENSEFSDGEILKAVNFQEKYFKINVKR